jgi:hypothetical protein
MSATLLVSLAGIQFSGTTATAATTTTWTHVTTTIAPSDDTFVAKEVPNWLTGSLTKLHVQNTTTTHRQGYLKVTVPQSLLGTTGQIESVVLGLTYMDTSRSAVSVRSTANTSWTEANVKYANAPVGGAIIAPVVQGTSTATANLTSITAAGTYGFQLTTTSGMSHYYSSESTVGPPTFAVTVKTPVVGGTCAPAFPGDRCGKPYYGAAVEGGDPAAFETSIGSTLGLYRSYMSASTATSRFVSVATRDTAKGEIPLISTKVPGTWAQVAAGAQDAWLLERIRALAKVNGTVWLALHHEPTGDGAPADWIKMQQHARVLIKANSTNIALVGILNGWDFLQNNPHPEVWNMPVGTGVDIMGFDSYNLWSPTNGKTWQPASKVLSPAVTIASWGYPTLVGEYGVRNDPANPGKAAQWMKDAYAFAVANKFAGLAYFNSGQNSPDGTWALSGERIAPFTASLGSSKTR